MRNVAKTLKKKHRPNIGGGLPKNTGRKWRGLNVDLELKDEWLLKNWSMECLEE